VNAAPTSSEWHWSVGKVISSDRRLTMPHPVRHRRRPHPITVSDGRRAHCPAAIACGTHRLTTGTETHVNDTASDAKQEALLRLVRARDARDTRIKNAIRAADDDFWALVTEELDRRPKVLKQREAAAAIGYHRDTIRRHAERVRAQHHEAREVTHSGADQDESADGRDERG
jgi:hypothetical protein